MPSTSKLCSSPNSRSNCVTICVLTFRPRTRGFFFCAFYMFIFFCLHACIIGCLHRSVSERFHASALRLFHLEAGCGWLTSLWKRRNLFVTVLFACLCSFCFLGQPLCAVNSWNWKCTLALLVVFTAVFRKRFHANGLRLVHLEAVVGCPVYGSEETFLLLICLLSGLNSSAQKNFLPVHLEYRLPAFVPPMDGRTDA